MNYQIDFSHITKKAYRCLFFSDNNKLPIDPLTYRNYGVKINVESYRRYAEITGVSVNELLQLGMNDGFTILSPYCEPTIVYNETAFAPRLRYTIAHELGHIILEHKSHGAKEEIEANFFASQYLAPTAIFAEIKNRGYFQEPYEKSIKMFALSRASGMRKLDYLNKYGVDFFEHRCLSDDYITYKYRDFLNEYYPIKKGSARYVWDRNDYILGGGLSILYGL